MKYGITLCLLAVALFGFTSTADAHARHHYRHVARSPTEQQSGMQFGCCFANFFQPEVQKSIRQSYAHHRHSYSSGAGITRARLADGQVISVSSAYADRFIGFFNALYRREGRLAHITCLASGHMANSLHHWGGACDVGQTARNVAWRAMYHVGALAGEYGLTDGCVWSRPDCGHVDVSGVGGGRHYATLRRSRYANRHRIRYTHGSNHRYAGA
jgi:hypothetical protein